MKILNELSSRAGKVVKGFPVVYNSLEQVLSILQRNTQQQGSSEFSRLLKVAEAEGLVNSATGKPLQRPMNLLKQNKPLIVVEGLDGSGKTKVSTALAASLNVKLMRSPPDPIREFKPFFDEEPEYMRRAYYTLGNYISGHHVNSMREEKDSKWTGFIMDRYWPSTVCYATTHELTFNSEALNFDPQKDYFWPIDLIQPNLVIFLIVSEAVRRARHATRNTTNTREEKLLAENVQFRKILIESYDKIVGPPLYKLNAEDEIEIVAVKVYKKCTETFPEILR